MSFYELDEETNMKFQLWQIEIIFCVVLIKRKVKKCCLKYVLFSINMFCYPYPMVFLNNLNFNETLKKS